MASLGVVFKVVLAPLMAGTEEKARKNMRLERRRMLAIDDRNDG